MPSCLCAFQPFSIAFVGQAVETPYRFLASNFEFPVSNFVGNIHIPKVPHHFSKIKDHYKYLWTYNFHFFFCSCQKTQL